MAERNLALNERIEARRDPQVVTPPVQFELEDIEASLKHLLVMQRQFLMRKTRILLRK